MPYIRPRDRGAVDPQIANLIHMMKEDADPTDKDGVTNYVITRIIDQMYPQQKYREYNSVMGVLSCVQQEFYRRRVVPFEEEKRQANGEVYL